MAPALTAAQGFLLPNGPVPNGPVPDVPAAVAPVASKAQAR
jgi:hypothetical protein